MKPPSVLVVEDNVISRKMTRVSLQAAGYRVLEAPDARTALALAAAEPPDLILQDLLLPDMDGFALVRRLRALPGCATVPLVAVSGLLSRAEEAKLTSSGFDDFLSKPVEPSRLVEVVGAFVSVSPHAEAAVGGLSVLVADDDPVQLRLARVRLTVAGFRVTTAPDGLAALEAARAEPPRAILSDVLMPGMDGFRLCLAIRADERLRRIPVVLVTSSFLEENDRRLAEEVGANAFVLRTPDLAEAVRALRESFGAEPPLPHPGATLPDARHVDDVVRRLEHQAALSGRLAQRCAVQAAALSVLSGIAETLTHTDDIGVILREVLARCVDAGGMSRGALFIVGPQGRLRLEAWNGYPEEAAPRLATRFGQEALLREILEKGTPALFPSGAIPEDANRTFLATADAASAVVVPIVSQGERLGLLLLASSTRDLEGDDWLAFARTLAAQLGQAVALTKAFGRVAASERRYRGLMESANDAILVVDVRGTVLEVNQQAERLAGRPRAEIVGRPYAALIPEAERADSAERIAHLLREGSVQAGPRHVQRRDGECVPVELSSAVVETEGETVILSIARDVSERLRAEETLRESEARYRSLFDRNLAGVYRTSLDGRVLECNEAFARVYGYASREEILGRDAKDLYPPSAPRETFLAALETQGTLSNWESQGRRKDGTIVSTLENVTLVDAGAAGVIEGTIIDITERKRLEQQLRQSQKMEAVGQLASGVAHDFNNLLSVIGGYSELVLKGLPDDDPQRKRIEGIRNAGERAADLTRQLLSFGRKQVLSPVVLDLNQVVAGLEGMLRRLIPENIQIVSALDSGAARAKADPGQMEQLIVNLAVNARDAMPDGGRLILEVSAAKLDEDYCRRHTGARPGRYVLLAVSDTGVGMDAETQAHIFEPFFTTKEVGRGTGLGLATVYGIVKQHDGYISVYSEIGHGTTFKVYLPRVEGPVARRADAAPSLGAQTGSETVLLVEDDEALRELNREIVAGLGYRVLEARDGGAALEASASHEGPIHLLLTDMVMPHMTGRQLAERLRSSRPGIKVLLVSGYTNEVVVRNGALGAGIAFLQKPFTPDSLGRKIREVLGAPA